MSSRNLKLCSAKARTNGYRQCAQPSMRNGKCRLHGGYSTGARTSEGKKKIKVANTKHGFYSTEAISERKRARLWIRQIRSEFR